MVAIQTAIESGGEDWRDRDLRALVVELRETGNMNFFCGKNLAGVNLRKADLRGFNFKDTNLSGADLFGAIIDNTTNLKGVDWSEANLTNITGLGPKGSKAGSGFSDAELGMPKHNWEKLPKWKKQTDTDHHPEPEKQSGEASSTTTTASSALAPALHAPSNQDASVFSSSISGVSVSDTGSGSFQSEVLTPQISTHSTLVTSPGAKDASSPAGQTPPRTVWHSSDLDVRARQSAEPLSPERSAAPATSPSAGDALSSTAAPVMTVAAEFVIPPEKRVWRSAGGKLDIHAQAAALRVIDDGTDLPAICLICHNAFHYNYQGELFKQDAFKKFLLESPEQLEGLQKLLTAQGVILTVTVEGDARKCTMTRHKFFLDKAFSEQTSEELSLLPKGVLDDILGQYCAIDFTKENSEESVKTFSSPGNHQRKREILEEALKKEKGYHLFHMLFPQGIAQPITFGTMLRDVDLTGLPYDCARANKRLVAEIFEIIFTEPGRDACKSAIIEKMDPKMFETFFSELFKRPGNHALKTEFITGLARTERGLLCLSHLFHNSWQSLSLSGVDLSVLPYDFTDQNTQQSKAFLKAVLSAPGNQKLKREIFVKASKTRSGLARLNETLGEMPPGHRPNLAGVDLSGLDLTVKDTLPPSNLYVCLKEGMNFYGADLAGANLRGTRLPYANLRDATLTRAVMHGVNLENADLRGGHLNGNFMDRANLKHTNLDGATLTGDFIAEFTDFRCARLIGTNLTYASLTLIKDFPVDFSGAVLQNIQLPVIPYGCSLSFSHARLTDVDLSGLRVSAINFHSASLKKVDLSKIKGCSINMHGATLNSVNVKDTNLDNAVLTDATLQKVNIPKAASLLKIKINAATLAHLGPGDVSTYFYLKKHASPY